MDDKLFLILIYTASVYSIYDIKKQQIKYRYSKKIFEESNLEWKQKKKLFFKSHRDRSVYYTEIGIIIIGILFSIKLIYNLIKTGSLTL